MTEKLTPNVICDHCQQNIADDQGRIAHVTFAIVPGGDEEESVEVDGLDFCCTEHLRAWLDSQPVIPLPG